MGELRAIGVEVLYADYSIVRIAAELFFTVGSVLSLAVGPFLWGLAWMRTMGMSRWIGWTAFITGSRSQVAVGALNQVRTLKLRALDTYRAIVVASRRVSTRSWSGCNAWLAVDTNGFWQPA